MRYTVRLDDRTREWLIFDVMDTFELVGMFKSEEEAKEQASRLEQKWQRTQSYSRDILPGIA